MEDISERKLAEEALEESEKRYRMLFEHAAEGIMVLDLQSGKFKFANPAICKMLGYKAKELTTMGVKDIYPRKELKRVLRKFSEQIEGEKRLAQNIPCLRKDGSLIYVNINSTRVVLDGVECNVGFFSGYYKKSNGRRSIARKRRKISKYSDQYGRRIF